MPDIAMSVALSRTALALPALEINDHLNYAVATQFLGGNVQWNRQQVSSPFLDGQVTTQRSRQNVTEQIAVEIYAGSGNELQINTRTLIAAFSQSDYVLTVVIGGATYAYQCEAADVQTAWVGVRLMANQGQVVFGVPRQPLALLGGV